MSDHKPNSIRLDGKSYVDVPSIPAYDVGKGAFTVEAWVLTKSAGTIVARSGDPGITGIGWWLGVEDDGAIVFGTCNREAYVVARTKLKLTTFDGSWHHVAVVRDGLTPIIYFDGVPIPLSLSLSTDKPVDVDSNLPVTVGALSAVGSGGQRRFLDGNVDEVRIWNRALAKWEVDQGIYRIIAANVPALIMQLSFDDDSFDDSSRFHNKGTPRGLVAFDTPGFYSVPDGQSFFVVQTRLLEDYAAASPGAAVTPMNAFRVTIGVRDGNATPQAADITISADRATSIIHRGKTLQVGPDNTVTLKSNAQNEINLQLKPEADSLVMPILKLHADFMKEGERILVPVDRQIHHALSMVTGDELRSGSRALLDPGQYTAQQAEAVAATIRNVMTSAVEHDMQPADPEIEDRPHALRTPTARRNVQRVVDPSHPEQECYLPVDMPCPCCDPSSDLVKCHYTAQDGAISRRVVPAYMTTPSFSFDVKNRTFTPTTPEEARIAFARAAAAETALVLRAEGTSIWESFVNGLLSVVDLVVSAGEAIIDGIAVAIHYVVDGVVKIADFIVKTVQEAADFVKGLLKALSLTVEKAINFLKAVFDWQAILRTHRVVRRFVGQSLEFSAEFMQSLRRVSDRVLDKAKADIDERLEAAIAHLGPDSVARGSAPATTQPPGDLRSSYVRQHIADNRDACTAQPWSSQDEGALQQLVTSTNTSAGTDIQTFKQANDAAVAALVPADMDIMSQVMAAILQTVKAGIDLAIDIAKAIIDAFLDFLAGLLTKIKEVAEQRIDIPVITWLYENVITGDGSKLSLIDLMALAGAIPAHIACVMATGKAPFDEAFVAHFETMTWRDYPFYHLLDERGALMPVCRENRFSVLEDDTPDWLVYLSAAQTGVFAASGMTWFALMAYLDAKSPLDADFNNGAMVAMLVFQGIAQGASYPIYMKYDANTPAALEVSIWALQFLPFALDGVNMGFAVKKPAAPWAKTFLDTVQPGIVGAWGIIHASLFAALMIWEYVDYARDSKEPKPPGPVVAADIGLKFVGNLVSVLPEIFQLLKYDPRTAKAVPVIDVASGVGMTVVSVTRLIMNLVAHHVQRAR